MSWSSARFQYMQCVKCVCYKYRAINTENDEANNVKNQVTGEWGPIPDTARKYKVRYNFLNFQIMFIFVYILGVWNKMR